MLKKLQLGCLLCIIAFCSIIFVPAYTAPIKIFQIGFNKCGTTTLADYFNANGIKSVHFDHGVIAKLMYRNYLENRRLIPIDYEKNYIGYFDMNSVRESEPIEMGAQFVLLDQQYPGSKFILNTRDKKKWLNSRINHMTMYGISLLDRYAQLNGVSSQEMLEIWSKQWDTHHQAILEYFKDRPNDLIVFNIETDPPEKLSKFFKPYFSLDTKHYKHKNKTKVNTNSSPKAQQT